MVKEAIRPLQAVMIVLVLATIAGGTLFVSAAKPAGVPDGAIAWGEESPLRALVQVLCLNYQFATPYAGAIKSYILGLGSALALLALTIAVIARERGAGEDDATGAAFSLAAEASGDANAASATQKVHVAPLVAAQIMVGLFLLWSFASSRWSLASDLALGGSVILCIQYLWAFSLGHGLGPSAAIKASRVVLAVLVLTAVVAIWYHYGRKPTMRADFPVGNPSFLASCLIPGILLAIGLLLQSLKSRHEKQGGRSIAVTVVAAASLGLLVWAFRLTDARGPAVGLAFGVMTMAFLALKGKARLVPIALAIAACIAGALYIQTAGDASLPGGRSDTLRLREHAWGAAMEMFVESPFKGHGQGGFALTGDARASAAVLDDPAVFTTRIAHAHNEWLEVLADLGAVGIVLLLTAGLMTLRAGMIAADTSRRPTERWTLIALVGSIVGLGAASCFGVDLRIAGVPTVFYTIVGLTWAMSARGLTPLADRLSINRNRRILAGVVGGSLGLIALVVTQTDFAAARSSHAASAALFRGDFDKAIQFATQATDRLDPQRALTNLYRLADVHLHAAQYLQQRAQDRFRRAAASDQRKPRMLAAAQADLNESDLQCEAASRSLKELVLRSPDFFNRGRLGFSLHLTRARNASARGDRPLQTALLSEAAASAWREIDRQPFDPSLAIDYLSVASAAVEPINAFDVLARPLRYHAFSEPEVGGPYVNLLEQLMANPRFDQELDAMLTEAELDVGIAPDGDDTRSRWQPERLRLGAAIMTSRKDYRRAVALLEKAMIFYEGISQTNPLSLATCLDELSIARFLADPVAPATAIALALRAIDVAPSSFQGRELVQVIRQRLIRFHLAAGDEARAVAILTATAPAGVTEEDVQRELAVRYRRLCESVLGSHNPAPQPSASDRQLMGAIEVWVARSLRLNSNDNATMAVAAETSLRAGDDESATQRMRLALQRGFPIEAASVWVQDALTSRPDSGPLRSLADSLSLPPQSSRGMESSGASGE